MTEAKAPFSDEFFCLEMAGLLAFWIVSSGPTSGSSCGNVRSLSSKHCWCFNFLHRHNLAIISSSVSSWFSQSQSRHTISSSFNSDGERGVSATVGSEPPLIINSIQRHVLIICNFFPSSAKLLNSILIASNQSFRYCGLENRLTLALRSCHQDDSGDLCQVTSSQSLHKVTSVCIFFSISLRRATYFLLPRWIASWSILFRSFIKSVGQGL